MLDLCTSGLPLSNLAYKTCFQMPTRMIYQGEYTWLTLLLYANDTALLAETSRRIKKFDQLSHSFTKECPRSACLDRKMSYLAMFVNWH